MPLMGKLTKDRIVEDDTAWMWNSEGKRRQFNKDIVNLDAGLKEPAPGTEPPVISTQLLAEARRAGLDLNALAPDELDAFASGGVAGLTRYRQNLWDDEADKRPAQPGVMA